MGSGTLCTITGNRTHLEVLFTNALGDEGGRTAAVTVSSPNTAQRQHDFALFVRRKTNGVIGATAIVHNQNQSAIFLNTNHGTGSIIVTTLLSSVNEFAILNNHAEGNTNCVEQSTLCEILVNISLAERLDITRNITFRILEYIKDGGSVTEHSTFGSYIFTCITDPLAVVNKHTGRVGVVVQVGVHTANDVVSESVLVILGHFGQFLMRPVSLIFQIFVDLVVSRNDGYIRVRRVDLDNVENLSTGTSSVVKYDFGLNSCAGNQYVILFRDHVVVTVCTKACAIEDHIFLGPIGNRCKCVHRKHTYKHYGNNQNGHYASCCFHRLFSFLKTNFIFRIH